MLRRNHLIQIGMLVTLLCVTPFILRAQEAGADSVVLRSEIRAALLADARSSDLSEEEVAVLVESLASEAEAQGIASEFLPERAPVQAARRLNDSWNSLSEPMLYGIVLFSLALAMVLMKRIIESHHAHGSPPDTPAAA